MKKSIVLSFALSFVSSYLLAQVTGLVTDNNNKPLPSATISLQRTKDSSIAKFTTTDKDGKFEIANINTGNYFIAVKNIGFAEYNSKSFSINDKQKNIELGALRLNTISNTLGAVTVTAKKPLIERKADRTVINVDAFISNAGSNALEVLERSPGVQVDNNDAISLQGKSGVTIYIDDRPTYLSGTELANYLKSLPAGTLDKIEIFTTPPSKYDAAGTAGIINIKTKKNKQKGFNGSVNISFRQGFYGDSRNTLNFNYRNNKFNFFSNILFSKGATFYDLTINRWYTDANNNIASSFTQNTLTKRTYNSLNGKFGLDYSLSKKSTLGLVFNNSGRPSTEARKNIGTFFNAQRNADSIILADNSEKERFKNSSINLNFRHQFDSLGKELNADADYISYSTTNEQLFKNSSYTSSNTLKTKDDLIGSLPSDINIYSFKVDYTQPLSKSSKLEAGIKTSYINTDNLASYFTSINNITAPDYDKSNHFIYKENINAAYANYSLDKKRWNVQLGLRAENTMSRGHQLGNAQRNDSSFKRNYINLFPTFFFSYKLDSNGNNQLNFAYSKRIDRPYYADLNPFISPLDKFTYYAGNPFLNPQFTQHFELAHAYKSTLVTTFFYDRIRDEMDETIELSGNTFISRTGNIGKKDVLGITVDATIKPTKWWTITPFFLYQYVHTQSKVYTEDVNTTGNFYMASALNQFTFNRGWSMEVFGRYRTNNIEGQFVGIHWGQMNMGVQKKILKNKGSLKANIIDMFRTRINAGEISGLKGGVSNYRNLSDSRALIVAFTYNFSKGAKANQNNKKGGAEDEQNRVKQ